MPSSYPLSQALFQLFKTTLLLLLITFSRQIAAHEEGSDPVQDKKAREASVPFTTVGGHADESSLFETNVKVKKSISAQTPSEFILNAPLLSGAPKMSTGELLNRAPGFYSTRSEGDAIAHHIYLRGFDAEHGQDIEFLMGGIPLNQSSHIHGQGYSDLNFIIPETIRSLRVLEGVYDAIQGDFATAGSVEFDLGVAQRGVTLRTQLGSFLTFRQLALWAPRGEAEETFAAVTFSRTNGFGSRNRASMAATAIGQYHLDLSSNTHLLLSFGGHGVRANIAGVLRQEDIAAGVIGFYDTYNDPSAQSQSAMTAHGHISAALEHNGERGERSSLTAWFVLNDYNSRQNFTGYLERAQINPAWVGNGDLIEQRNRDYAFGVRAFHRFRRLTYKEYFTARFEIGLINKNSIISQTQNLLKPPDNATWDQRVDADILQSSVGAYGDMQMRIMRQVDIHVGLRVDALYFNINDKLSQATPAFRKESYIKGYRRTALGAAVGPRFNIAYEPLKWLKMSAAYGEGYRSPQARLLSEGEEAPFAQVRSTEGSIQLRPLKDNRITLTMTGYGTFLQSDLAFDPSEGRLEKIGPTSRRGFLAALYLHPWPWITSSFSLTYVNAALDAPPEPTAENPLPQYRSGEALPYVPPVVLREDLVLEHALTTIKGHPLVGHLGIGLTYLSPRPLPYQQRAKKVVTLDVSASLKWHFVELGVEIYNLANQQNAAEEYMYTSYWPTRSVPSLVPAKHVAAGSPLTALGTLSFYF